MIPTASLSTGTVTFLFTDIEGSTRLWEEQTEAMHRDLAHHDALLRTAIGDAEGPRIRLTLVSLPGKSHVEVTAAFAVGRGTRVLSCAFPRHDPAALAAGLLGQ